MNPSIEESWKNELWEQFNAPYFHELKHFLVEEKTKYQIFPPGKFIFNAFNLTPFDKVKVVLLGQDPYHDNGQAHGLCFSVQDGIAHPRSLINIFKELRDDIGKPIPISGNLEDWAKQGVLLLNATLTVRAHQAGSHQGKGWETFTDAVIRRLSEKHYGLIFLLWGRYAQDKIALIDTSKHHILKTVHPSPLSANRGFFGCKHFSTTNSLLREMGKKEIIW
ncbi:uracil-DNA glycosylase [Bacteroidales bacterium OttesenSCG-928-B11]|nr:uracil-DNA glycosylase [Bacteroidales bacterium OttesenSCG-928-C03]MDL2311883.1 uracil-DNA glycosylase [Bacteroidales bacterium OttesenSCG-928-B11]MDL2326160.1 uracil-DNA glycosylase [Bacteroidales bacterium OttesenSCG-928-A14]